MNNYIMKSDNNNKIDFIAKLSVYILDAQIVLCTKLYK